MMIIQICRLKLSIKNVKCNVNTVKSDIELGQSKSFLLKRNIELQVVGLLWAIAVKFWSYKENVDQSNVINKIKHIFHPCN